MLFTRALFNLDAQKSTLFNCFISGPDKFNFFLQSLYVRAQNQIKTMKSQRNIISMIFNHDLVSYYRLRERRSSSEEVFHLSVSIP